MSEHETAEDGTEDYQSKSIECPNCGMPFDVPEEVDHWSCDCGASWELDPRTDGGVDQSEAETEHETTGQIGGHEVTVTVTGPEAQELGDDDMRLGSDIVMLRVGEKLTEIKEELTDGE